MQATAQAPCAAGQRNALKPWSALATPGWSMKVDSNLKSGLRSRLLDTRCSLDERQRRRLDRRIRAHLLEFLEDRNYLEIAAFQAFRGEPDLTDSLEALHRAGRRIYLPVVRGEDMGFRRWEPGCRMLKNRYGIPEPVSGAEYPAEGLELVLTPLVAFSPAGLRLGMGAGFYDRAFAFCRQNPSAGPLLIGIAYGLQQVNSLPAESWDVPLGGVITERGLRMFRAPSGHRN